MANDRSSLWLWAVALILVGVPVGVVIWGKTRGLRNNNPGNIRKNSTAWQGLAPKQTDSAFFVFTDAKYGIRALGRTLLSYQRTHGISTVEGMINRWAPPFENDTSEYVRNVAKAMGVSPNQPVQLADQPALFDKMAKAIIRQENGVQPYPDALVAEALSMARNA